MPESDKKQSELKLKIALEELKILFPGILCLNIHQITQALNLKSTRSVQNGLRKDAKHKFPIAHRKLSGRLYWSILDVAAYLAEV